MSVSEAQKKASAKYLEKLDEIRIRMPKGKKDSIKAVAATAGESVNQYILGAVDQRMERDTPQKAVGGRTTHAVDGVVSLPSGDAERAPAASEGRVESVDGKVAENGA